MAVGGNFTNCNCGPDAQTCESPTQPVATVGLCLADGTPIAVTIVRDCAGTITSEGWINLVTGQLTAGPPPADAGACDAGCVDTLCRQLCDDTDGDGQPDATYSQLWCIKADGTAELVLTYQDDPSTPYTPVAPVDCTYGCAETETLTLCDASGPFLRRYTWLQDVATFQDFALDGSTLHVVTGTVGACAGGGGSGAAPCAEQTTPAATLGLCLADGTPIAVVITRDCATDTVTQDGWINLLTGMFSMGAPPAGAAACGDSRAFELAGLLCDVLPDGTVAGLVLVEYEYNADGSLASVRLVDPATGSTYTLQGELGVCPGGTITAGADLDLIVLCDVQADGTSTPFLRDYRRDPDTGLINGHTDYGLDGTLYTVTGTVGQCTPDAEPCRNTNAFLLCDAPTDGTPTPTVTDTNPTPYYPYATGAPVAGAQTLWDSGALNLPAGTAPQPGTPGKVNILAATIQAARPVCDTGTAHVAVSLNVLQQGPDDGCAGTGHLRLFNGTTQTSLVLLPANTPAGYFGTVTVEADVPAADLAAGNIAFALALDAYDDTPGTCSPSPRRTGWQLSAFTATATYDQAGCDTQFLRTVTTDCETGAVVSVADSTLDGAPYTVSGEAGQCSAAGGGSCCPDTPCPAQNIIEACRCDDTDADGVSDVDYVELLAVDCAGAITSLGTYTADLSAPYTPVAPVDCDGGAAGADPAFGVQARRVELAVGAAWDAAAWPTLQSVTAVAYDGTGTVTTVDGPSTLRGGETVTWSVERDDDARLTGPLTIAAATGTVTVTFTIGVML
ncbi:hypothetical protein ABT300_09005 [Streptomyces sp. NPDC001027]|uniref:hypothetical protein n=1 Tax=Streptomyces sp. NPDC001027 TaxID=3154771 RepID=UPI0033198F72